MFRLWLRNFSIMGAIAVAIGVVGVGFGTSMVWLSKHVGAPAAGILLGIIMLAVTSLGLTYFERRT